MKVKDSFGSWLRQRRRVLDLTQIDLADQVGCSVVTIRKIESDERRPSKQITERLADVLAVSLEERAEFVAFARHTGSIPLISPLHSAAAAPPHNLPPQPTPFIGRTNELAQISKQLNDSACRLLTLVGPGGIGKTRLALQAATDQLPNFANGVYFVSLTGVGSPNLVASAIAGALEFSFYGSDGPDVQLVHYLRNKAMLLVLDNFEHLLQAVGLLSEILSTAPGVKLLTTSRERLNLQEEWTIAVEGLPFPNDGAIDALESYSAVQLFVQRALQVQSHFSLEQNAESVLMICRAVDGTPLGLELAASWLRVMSCHQIAAQLDRTLDFLTTSLRNIPERHRSLRAVFEQSWGLLSEVERRVLAALSVFRGGFDLEAAEQVAGASPSVLARLADKSLIRLNAADRYDLHELLRQFAADKLAESGEVAAVNRRHLAHFSLLADKAETYLYGPQQELWFDRLEVEHDNINAALAWALKDDKVEAGLRLAGALEFFWEFRSYFHHEGSKSLDKLLAIGGDASATVRAKALRVARMTYGEGESVAHDCAGGRVYLDESLRLARATGDKAGIAWALGSLGQYGDPTTDTRRAWLEEALTLFREIGDGFGISHMLRRLAGTLTELGDYERARLLAEEALALARAAKDKNATAWALTLLGRAIWFQNHDPEQTSPLMMESLCLAREVRDRFLIANTLFYLGEAAQAQKDYGRAQDCYAESLATFQEMGIDKRMAASELIGLGELARAQGRPVRAARLFGTAAAFTEGTDDILPGGNDFKHGIAPLRAQLGEAAFAAAWAEGRVMTPEHAIAYALEK